MMKYAIKIIIFITITVNLFSEPGLDIYQYRIKDRVIAKYKIYSKNDILYCTGDTEAGLNNNKAAQLISNGNFPDAEKKLIDNLEMSPLFLPTHYNLAITYIYQNRLDKAIFHLKKATLIFPKYYLTYIQLGYIYDRKNKFSRALDFYRKSFKLHPRNLKIYTLMGNIYFNRKQYRTALKYYKASLKIQRDYPNGLIGMAKINFINEKYLIAINQLKSISLKADYDISYHYYFAESSYKMRDYNTAYREYKKLLEYKNNRFFLTNSYLLIQHKMNMAKRFTER